VGLSSTLRAMARRSPNSEAREFTRQFSVRLRDLRKGRGWTQAELGEMIGVDGSVIRSYELKLHNPPLFTLQRLAKSFGVSIDFLLNGSSRPPDGFADRELLDLFLKADSLHHTKKSALKQVIEGLVVADAHPQMR